MIVAQAAVRAWWVGRSWFLVDDFVFLSDIARGIDDPDWYMRLHQGHFMPLSFGLVKIVAELGGPYDWSAVTVEIVVLQVLASLACWWMLHTLFRSPGAVLGGLALYLTSALTMPSMMWWAVAINHLPNQIAFFGAVAAHVQFARTRRVRWVAVATGFLVIGYLSYAKAGLTVVTLVLLTLIWLVAGTPWHRFWTAVRRFWLAWFAYGLVSVAWLVLYVTRPQPRLPQEPAQFIPLAQSQVLENLVPTIFGGPWSWVPFAEGSPVQFAQVPLVGVVVAALVLAFVLLQAWGTRQRALLVLWPVAVFLLASTLLVYTGRAYSIGLVGANGIGRHVQYLSDMAPLLVLAAVALFVPVRDVADPVRIREEPLVRWRPSRPLVAGLVTIVAVGGLISSSVYVKAWESFPERTANETAVAELEQSDDVQLVDSAVPAMLLSPLLGDKALVKNHFAPLADHFSVSDVGVDLDAFDADGRLVRADLTPADDRPVTNAFGECRTVDAEGISQEVRVPFSFGLWLVVDYRAAESGRITVTGTGAPVTGYTVPAGTHRLLIAAPAPSSTVRVYTPDGQDLCVDRLAYGLVGSS